MLKKVTIFSVFLFFLFVPFKAAQMADSGASVYDSKCKMCHGPDGKADTKAGKMMKVLDLTVEANWKGETSQEAVEKIILEGLGKMPKYEGKLSEAEITAVSAYFREMVGVSE